MKKVIFVLLGLVAALLVGAGVYLQTALPAVSAAPELKIDATPERLKRGEYLAKHVCACLDCHSSRDWSRYAGPPRAGTEGGGGERFPLPFGDLYAPNLTPQHLGTWTDGELYRAITAGVSRDKRALFPLMPYPRYGQMAQEDIYSIIAYLRSLPSLPTEVPPSQLKFPMSMIVKTMPKDGQPQPIPQDEVGRGKYLVGAAACADCHTPVDKGKPLPGKDFAGGRDFTLLDGQVVRSANITPDVATGIGNWDKGTFVNRFRKAKTDPVAAGAHNTVMPWGIYTELSEEDLAAMYAYLKTVPAVSSK